MAIDGDPDHGLAGGRPGPAEGQRIRLEVAEPIDHVTLHQPQGAGAVRHLGAVTIDVDGRAPLARRPSTNGRCRPTASGSTSTPTAGRRR